MPNNPTYLGTVQDVQGATISVALDKDTVSGLAFIEGHGYRIGQIGSFIRIPIGFIDLFGRNGVKSLFLTLSKNWCHP